MPNSNGIFLASSQTASQQSESFRDTDAWTTALVHALASQSNNEASSESLSPWHELALSIVRQSLVDAGEGDYDALAWLISEGREWLDELGVSPWVVDVWECDLP